MLAPTPASILNHKISQTGIPSDSLKAGSALGTPPQPPGEPREAECPMSRASSALAIRKRIDALVEYCAATKHELPKGGLKRLVFSNDAEIKVTAEFNGD